MSTPATLTPAQAARFAGQARAVARAAATHRKVMELQPRFGWPATISQGDEPPTLFVPPSWVGASVDFAARTFECHPALLPAIDQGA